MERPLFKPGTNLSLLEYKMDRVEFERKQKPSYSDHTFSVHSAGIIGETPGLASLFEEAPKIENPKID